MKNQLEFLEKKVNINIEKFIEIIKIIELAINKEYTIEQKQIYYHLLKDVEDKVLLQGIHKMLNERVYTNLPTVAEIRKFCEVHKENIIKKEEFEIKERIFKAIKIVNKGQIVFDKPVIHVILKKIGGLNHLSKLDVNSLNYVLKDLPNLLSNYEKFKIDDIELLIGKKKSDTQIIKNENGDYEPKYKIIINVVGDKLKTKEWIEYYSKKKINLTLDEIRKIDFNNEDNKNLLANNYIIIKDLKEIIEVLNER
ncbi:hypothetical protein KX935_07765 [Streptobacillus moniliformis]|uniref:hypothetical protein n=2 Tax=Streptobacillus moniliformis TaxID=34105 RepID=UPI0007E42F11|nr:hypothetical protein [Streptobacillus moniliformis]QXW65641.1 hypothetical protein KX935_07765 [Streptobacillus moniliformis]